MAISTVVPPGRRQERVNAAIEGMHRPYVFALNFRTTSLLWCQGGLVFEAHRLLRLKDLLGPVTRVKKKKKSTMAISTVVPPGRRQEEGDAAMEGMHLPSVSVSCGMNLSGVSGLGCGFRD